MTTPESKLAGVEPVAVEVTNGTIDPAHYGPIGDAARHIASYCEGRARVHVYTAAFDTLTAWNTRATPPAQTSLVEALEESIAVFEGMCDDEIEVELLPRLRAALSLATGERS